MLLFLHKLSSVIILLSSIASGTISTTSTTSCTTGTIGSATPKCEVSGPTLFGAERYPNIVVAMDGTVLAFAGKPPTGIGVRRSLDGGSTWSARIPITDGSTGLFHSGGAIVDETTGHVLVFGERRPLPSSVHMFRSRDAGLSWSQEIFLIHPDAEGRYPSMHMNEHGITLQHHSGRLLRPTRYYGGNVNASDNVSDMFVNAIYSDDGGHTWNTSEPFPSWGTGEAAVAELSDGSIYYNTRVFTEEQQRPTRRQSARSYDGGQTWTNFSVVEALPDGRQDRAYGCMAGIVRLPLQGHDYLVFSNIEPECPSSECGFLRERTTVWLSLDGGFTWPIQRLVHEGGGYSSLAVGRKNTSSENWIYILFEIEYAPAYVGNIALARFNLAWLLDVDQSNCTSAPAIRSMTNRSMTSRSMTKELIPPVAEEHGRKVFLIIIGSAICFYSATLFVIAICACHLTHFCRSSSQIIPCEEGTFSPSSSSKIEPEPSDVSPKLEGTANQNPP